MVQNTEDTRLKVCTTIWRNKMKKYKNPPIVEALCEFQFIPGQPWDITIPGIIYEKIKNQFPEKKQQMGIGLGIKPREAQLESKIEMLPSRMQFLRHDKKALIQIGLDLLVVNHLKPYPHWENFKPMILENFKIYLRVAKPRGIRRVGLRYINRIDFESAEIELESYFKFYPKLVSDLPQVYETFIAKVEIPYEEQRDKLILSLTTAVPERPGMISIILDLDYAMVKPEAVPLDDIETWIEKAHTNLENAFEACITDKCRELFGEEGGNNGCE